MKFEIHIAKPEVKTAQKIKVPNVVSPQVGKLTQNVSFVNHWSVNKLHTSVSVNPLFSALINGS